MSNDNEKPEAPDNTQAELEAKLAQIGLKKNEDGTLQVTLNGGDVAIIIRAENDEGNIFFDGYSNPGIKQNFNPTLARMLIWIAQNKPDVLEEAQEALYQLMLEKNETNAAKIVGETTISETGVLTEKSKTEGSA